MPIYEFECSDCTSVFETIVTSSSQVEDVVCKQCGSTNVKKLLSTVSHRVEGSSRGLSSAPPAGCGAGSPFK